MPIFRVSMYVATSDGLPCGSDLACIFLGPLAHTCFGLSIRFLQAAATNSKGKPPDKSNWAYSHNNCLMCYRMYFKNGAVDPSLPASRPPKPIVIPLQRPPPEESASVHPSPARAAGRAVVMVDTTAQLKEEDVNAAELEAIVRGDGPRTGADNRLELLQEVREHLELLREFQDVIPQEELNQRKRDLFLALPGAPPPSERKAARIE